MALALVIGLAACSSSKHTPSTAGTESHLQRKATEQITGFLAGKYDEGYQYLDAACQKRWTRQTWSANLASTAAELKAAGIDLSQDHLGSVTITDFTPTQATVTDHLLDKSGQDADSGTATTAKGVVWQHQNGEWVTSDCPAASSDRTPGTGGGSLVPASSVPTS